MSLNSLILTFVLIILVGMLSYVLFAREKGLIHYLFIAIICELIVWNTAVLLGSYAQNDTDLHVFIDNFAYFGAAFVPMTILQLGIAYQKDFKGFSWRYLLLYVLPAITMVVIFTNDYHHLFYLSYSLDATYVQGPYFFVYAVYSYACLITGMVLLSYAAIKASGALSLQAVLIVVGCLFPTIANICYTLHLPGFYVYTTPAAFTITIMFYLISMLRYGFLRVLPVATRTVVNRISDCFVVVDRGLDILDCNQAFVLRFSTSPLGKPKGKLDVTLRSAGLDEGQLRDVLDIIERVFMDEQVATSDFSLSNDHPLFYTVEYTPLSDRRSCSAVVILFKDVTQHVLDLRALKENQEILLERERLASLGQMIGGIAHNLKSPILAISGGIDQVEWLVTEYEKSAGDPEVTVEDHHEIAHEMIEWLDKAKDQLSYMSDIISTVKGQAAQFSEQRLQPFTVGEVLKRAQILMQHSLVKNGCQMKTQVEIERDAVILGDVNSLVQVLDNIIDNAIQAYNGENGQILLEARQVDGQVRFAVTDYGVQISPETQRLLFKEMTTTKGKHGTGLGLYMSYSTIKGMFRGNMWFESDPDRTSFFIDLPLVVG